MLDLLVEQVQCISYLGLSGPVTRFTSLSLTHTHAQTHTHTHSVGLFTRFNGLSRVCCGPRKLTSWNILHSRFLSLTTSHRYSASCCKNNFQTPTLWTVLLQGYYCDHFCLQNNSMKSKHNCIPAKLFYSFSQLSKSTHVSILLFRIIFQNIPLHCFKTLNTKADTFNFIESIHVCLYL
jgi:hypothetical protein